MNAIPLNLCKGPTASKNVLIFCKTSLLAGSSQCTVAAIVIPKKPLKPGNRNYVKIRFCNYVQLAIWCYLCWLTLLSAGDSMEPFLFSPDPRSRQASSHQSSHYLGWWWKTTWSLCGFGGTGGRPKHTFWYPKEARGPAAMKFNRQQFSRGRSGFVKSLR